MRSIFPGVLPVFTREISPPVLSLFIRGCPEMTTQECGNRDNSDIVGILLYLLVLLLDIRQNY